MLLRSSLLALAVLAAAPASAIPIGASAFGASMAMRVNDTSGVLLETGSAASVPLAAPGTSSTGIQRADPIAQAVFSAPGFGLDDLTFESDLPLLPEPSAFAALMPGLVGIWGLAVLGSGPRAAAPDRVRKS